MARGDKHLVTRISELRTAIKRKYNQFKYGTAETEQLLEKQYKPIITELKNTKPVKIEPKEEEDFKPNIYSSPKHSPPTLKPFLTPSSTSGPISSPITRPSSPVGSTVSPEDVFETSHDEEDVSQMLSTAEGQETASQYMNEKFKNELTRHYMTEMIKDIGGKSSRIDHKYGPRYEGGTLMIGDKVLDFEEDGSIIVEGTTYKPTGGLYELLFIRNPDDDLYDEADLRAYRNILMKSNAHKKGYKHNGNINRNTSTKYKSIIQDLFPKTVYSGKGLAYWDDPNELCVRLKLLSSSAEAGNNSHTNEILNIVEELREVGIIKGRGNNRYRSLLK